MSITVISLISAVQSQWYTDKVQAQEVHTPKTAQIKDSVVGSKATLISSTQNNRSVSYPRVDLSIFPVERNWSVRGRLTTYFSRYHPAIDIATARGTPVHPYASGVVVAAGYNGSFGKRITIEHNNGIETLYAHLDSINVTIGQTVDPTSIIGTIGSTGRSTGPHLHFQVTQNGAFLNPLTVLP